MFVILKRPLILAHRGASGDAPENTLAAFQLALRQGCDGIELDIHLSKDGQLVVIHDDTIDRTTNGKGTVGEMTVSELKKYDAGRWFSERFRGERIPLLEEVFSIVPKEIFINIEIKNIPSHYEGIEEKLINLLEASGRTKQVIVSSFDHQCLYRLKKRNSDVKIGLLYKENVVDHVNFANMFGLPVESLHPDYKAIGRNDIQKAVRRGIKVFPWTVNTKNGMKKMIEAGVSGIITNYPNRLKELIDEMCGKNK